MNLRLHHILCLLLILFVTACSEKSRNPKPDLSNLRPDPGIINWLQRQSFLYQAENNNRDMAETHSVWAPIQQTLPQNLVREAGLWLELNPYHIINRDPFGMLAKKNVLETLQQAGFSGIYISPLTEINISKQNYRPMSIEDSVSPSITQLGTEDSLHILRENARQHNLWIGTDSLSPSLGFGFDVSLAVRSVKPWASAFIMIKMPKDIWNILPQVSTETKDTLVTAPIDSNTHAELMAKGLIPQHFARDGMPWLSPSAWFVTNAFPGIDGEKNRWLMRKQQNFDRAILHLDNPSGTARRILTGSILQNMKIRKLSLLGLNAESAFGNITISIDTPKKLEPASIFRDTIINIDTPNILELGSTYIREFHRLVKSYEGFSLLRTAMPLHSLATMQKQGIDSVFDSVSSPAIEIALLTGDIQPFKDALNKSIQLGIEHNRLWRPLSNAQGILLPLVLGAGAPDLRPLAWRDACYYDGQRLVATLPALAAMRLGIDPEHVKTPESISAISNIHKNIFAFHAGLPGIVSITAQDMLGITHTPFSSSSRYVPFPAWSWGSTTASVTKHAIPKGQALYASPEIEILDENSFFRYIKTISALRNQLGITNGMLDSLVMTSNPAIASYMVTTNTQRIMVLMNFSNETITTSLPQMPSYTDAFTGQTLTKSTIPFAPFETKWLLIPL